MGSSAGLGLWLVVRCFLIQFCAFHVFQGLSKWRGNPELGYRSGVYSPVPIQSAKGGKRSFQPLGLRVFLFVHLLTFPCLSFISCICQVVQAAERAAQQAGDSQQQVAQVAQATQQVAQQAVQQGASQQQVTQVAQAAQQAAQHAVHQGASQQQVAQAAQQAAQVTQPALQPATQQQVVQVVRGGTLCPQGTGRT